MQALPIELLEFIPQFGSGPGLQRRNANICDAIVNSVTGEVRHRNNRAGKNDGLRLRFSAAHQGDLDSCSGSPRKQGICLPDRHLARRKVGNLFDDVTAAQPRFLRRTIGQYRNDHDVSKALGQSRPDFAARGVLLLLLKIRIFPGAQITGTRIRLQFWRSDSCDLLPSRVAVQPCHCCRWPTVKSLYHGSYELTSPAEKAG